MKQVSHDVLDKLKTIPQYAARVVSEYLKQANEADYIHFLDYMYHYTKSSEANLNMAGEYSHTEELKEYFEHMAHEERGHYLLAAKDLEGFSVMPSAHTPAIVAKIDAFWESQRQHGHGNAYLGIVYVFENIAQYVGSDIRSLLMRLETTKKQSRWLSVHAEADLEHGEEAEKLMLKYLPEDPELLLQSAQTACDLWVELMKEAFTSPTNRSMAS